MAYLWGGMDALSLSPFAPVALGTLGPVRPLQPTTAQDGNTSGSTAPTLQDLTQGLFRQTLQTSLAAPISEPGLVNGGLAPEATASLLAALTAPQATAGATPTVDTTTNAITQATPSSAPSPTPPVTATELPTQDVFANSSSLDFALQAALRFGAGVLGPGAAAQNAADLGTGLIRDATAVPRLEGLRGQAGAPGPEAYTQPQASAGRLLRDYEVGTPPVAAGGGVDLLA